MQYKLSSVNVEHVLLQFSSYPVHRYLLTMELSAVQMGYASCHLSTGGHSHQAIAFSSWATGIGDYFGTENLN